MKVRVEKITEKMKQNFLKYVLCLILSKNKKTCVGLSKLLKISHDVLYRVLAIFNVLIPFSPNLMIKMVNKMSKLDCGYLILDDTAIIKPFATLIEGVFDLYNTVLNKPDRGLCIVVLVWSNGKITIPLNFEWYFSKKIIGDDYKSKSAKAVKLLTNFKHKVSFKYLLADGHYSTKLFIQYLCKQNIKFIFKISRNKKIYSTSNQYEQLQNHKQLKLIKNQRSAKMIGCFCDYRLYFVVQKFKNKSFDYTLNFYVSNLDIKSGEYIVIYEKRWKIEVMFRTLKQYLGLQDCSSRSIEKQTVHVYSTFFAYGILQYEKNLKNFTNSEEVINHYSELKLTTSTRRIQALAQNFIGCA